MSLADRRWLRRQRTLRERIAFMLWTAVLPLAEPEADAIQNWPVSELNLSARARKCMNRLGINTLGELVQRTADELLESKNFGQTSLTEVRDRLAQYGLSLRND